MPDINQEDNCSGIIYDTPSSSHDRQEKTLNEKSQSHRHDIALKKVKGDSIAGPSTSGSTKKNK
jgi:hypothetical protein